jgi:iron complex transport system substrate-binding protein
MNAACRSGFGLTLLFSLAVVAAHAAPAQRIVSLAPHLTELAFTAGAGDRIVATVEYSNHPDQARDIPRIGDAFRVDLERLVALRPDAVLVWQSGNPAPMIERVRALHLPIVAFQTQRLEHVATALREIGRLAGTSDVAERAAADYERRIQQLRDHYRDRAPIRVFIEVDDQPLYTVNGRQIISEIVELCGGRNVFADLNEFAPAISIESVIAANPQAIISTDDTVPDAAATWKRWSHIEAVRAGNVYTLRSDDIARATTRLTVAAESVCRTLDTARQRLRAGPRG